MHKAHGEIVAQIARIRERANLFIETELKVRNMEGIVPAHGVVFAFLFRQEEAVPITSLVKETGRAKSTVTGMVKTLERYGYVHRIPSPDDGRSFHIGLTDMGRAQQKNFEEISSMLMHHVYGDMNGDDQQVLLQLLTRIENNLS